MHPPAEDSRVTPPAKLTLHEEKILEGLRDSFVSVLEVRRSEVKLGSRIIEDLGADSLGLVECILDVEERFSVDVPDEDTEKFVTVGDCVAYLARVVPS